MTYSNLILRHSNIFLTCLFSSAIALAAGDSTEPQSITSYNKETFKDTVQVLYPKSMAEYGSMIATAYKSGLPVRIVGRTHSTSEVVLAPDNGVYISTKFLNQIYGLVRKNGKTYIRVQPGVSLGQMDEYLSARNLSLGFAFPMFRDLTAAGVISTGSHGSSWTHTSMAAHTLGALRVFDPKSERWIFLEKDPSSDANVANDLALARSLSEKEMQDVLKRLSTQGAEYSLKSRRIRKIQDLLFKTATVDLGNSLPKGDLFIEVTNQFNIHMQTRAAKIDQILVDNEQRVNWNPLRTAPGSDDSLVLKLYFHAGQAIIESGNITKEPAMPGVQNVNFGTGFDSQEVREKTAAFMKQAHEDMAYGAKVEPARVSGTLASPLFVKTQDGKEVRAQEVIGRSESVTRARGDKLTWLFLDSDYSYSFPEAQAYKILKDIQAFALRTGYSFPFTGISCRFVTSDPSSSLLSHVENPGQPKGTRYVVMEFLEYRPLEHKGLAPETARSALLLELIDLLKKHKVKLHWGKNSTKHYNPEYINATYGESLEVVDIVTGLLDPQKLMKNSFSKNLAPQGPSCKILFAN